MRQTELVDEVMQIHALIELVPLMEEARKRGWKVAQAAILGRACEMAADLLPFWASRDLDDVLKAWGGFDKYTGE